MFFWKVETFMHSLKKYMPDLADILVNIGPKIHSGKSFTNLWEMIEPESIDYGLLEKSENIYVVSGDFKWNDIGSWNALYDVLSSDKNGNIIKGCGKVMNANNNLIHSQDKFTAIIGLDDIVVINTDDATLVIPREKVEDVKDLVESLKANGQEKLI